MRVCHEPRLRSFWYPVAFTEDAAEAPMARRLLGEEIVVWVGDDGVPGAAVDRCCHRDARLSAGTIDGPCVVCPYHGWHFAQDGRATHIPQLEPGVPIPPRATLSSVRARTHLGLVWVALDEPLLEPPVLAAFDDPDYRVVRQFDETWAAAAPRLMDNSFDPAHVAFVHRASFGAPARARIDPPELERTPWGLVLRNRMEVENPDIARGTTGDRSATTVRTTTSEFHAPFVRIMSISYPTGRRHILFTAATPVDDEHLRLLQFAVRNDTEAEAPAEAIVAFDRQVTEEDRLLLETTDPDYELARTANVHIRVDRATLEVRRIYEEIVAGTWHEAMAS